MRLRHVVLRLPLMVLPLAPILLAMFLAACKPAGEAQPKPEIAKPSQTAAVEPATSAQPEEAAPADAEFPTLKIATLDGTPYDLAAHRGKWVVVNFWATWCKPCVKEMPELSALDVMREHIEVLGLAYDDSEPADIRAFLQKHPVAYPIAIVDTFEPPKSFATPRGLPTTYLIAPDGKMAKKFMGPISARDIEDAIAAAGGPKAG
ncbi:MAG TPA: TlpA disulfide reductase family protein [Lysobacter sp.]|jgi:thiol-disulfide isomerase/thioredoxin|nr:TlpA disulfide reductase family protein [Lysobacter sp.]